MTLHKITSGDYTLEHTIIEGIWGEHKNFFEIIKVKNGKKINYPFLPPPKATSFSPNDSIFKLEKYTQKECKKILDDWIRNEKL